MSEIETENIETPPNTPTENIDHIKNLWAADDTDEIPPEPLASAGQDEYDMFESDNENEYVDSNNQQLAEEIVETPVNDAYKRCGHCKRRTNGIKDFYSLVKNSNKVMKSCQKCRTETYKSFKKNNPHKFGKKNKIDYTSEIANKTRCPKCRSETIEGDYKSTKGKIWKNCKSCRSKTLIYYETKVKPKLIPRPKKNPKPRKMTQKEKLKAYEDIIARMPKNIVREAAGNETNLNRVITMI
jgi:hypothetical protein